MKATQRQLNNLKKGRVKGWKHREETKKKMSIIATKHNLSRTGSYNSWYNMKDRCSNIDNIDHKNYGGRGIKVCKKWLNIKNFYKDMGDKPKGLTLDRIDNDKGYYKENCRWATPLEQARNRKSNIKIKYKEETKCLKEWSEKLGIRYGTLWARLYIFNWSIEKAFIK